MSYLQKKQEKWDDRRARIRAMADVKVIPQSDAYRKNYDRIFKKPASKDSK